MPGEYRMKLDGNRIRFTPDGRVAVTDAIELLCISDSPEDIWRQLTKRHPELLSYCTDYRFPETAGLKVINKNGLEKMETLLVELMLETAA